MLESEILVPRRTTTVSWFPGHPGVVAWSGQVDTGLGPPALHSFEQALEEGHGACVELGYWNYGLGNDGLVHASVEFRPRVGPRSSAQSPRLRDPSSIVFVGVGGVGPPPAVAASPVVPGPPGDTLVTVRLRSPTPLENPSVWLANGSGLPPWPVVASTASLDRREVTMRLSGSVVAGEQYHVALQGVLRGRPDGYSIFHRFHGPPTSVTFCLEG